MASASSLYCKECGAANPAQATRCFACQELLTVAPGGTLTNPLTGLLLPSVLIHQRYRILDVLSTGEVSTIYRAEDTQLGNRVIALKEIGQNNLNTQEAVDTLEANRREMLLLAGLIHPHLPRIYEYFFESNRWYFVMDFLAGETLEEYLSRRSDKRLPLEEVLDIGIQLASVLDYLHAHQVPFSPNDLKLGNILRTDAGKLYLLDTRIPSQLASTPASSMIYSLGSTLRQLQTGRIPAGRRLRFASPRLRKRPQSLAVELLIKQMIDKNARKRPISMSIVKEELQHLAAQQASSAASRRSGFSRRTLLKAGRVVGIAGFVAAFSGGVTWLFELQTHRPLPGYSPGLGGTINTFNAGAGIFAVGWSPDGKRIASGGNARAGGGALVQIWDANTGKHVVTHRGHTGSVEALTWLPRGNEIASAGDDTTVQVWDATTGKTRQVYRGHANWVITVACSPNGKYIVSGGFDKTVQVWGAATARQVVIYRGHVDKVTAAAWSPDGRYIASASYDSTVQVWEAASGRLIFTYIGHTEAVYTVAWSPDGKYIASGGKDTTVQVWAALLSGEEGQPPAEAAGTTLWSYRVPYDSHNSNSGSVQAVAWSPDSIYVATASDGVQILKAATGDHLFTYSKHNGGVQAVEWSPNGKYIASGSVDGAVQVWNAR